MSAVDYILDGLERALELERELGVRTVEIDRGLLATEKKENSAPGQLIGRSADRMPSPVEGNRNLREKRLDGELPSDQPNNRPAEQGRMCQLCFLHDRPLSPAGVEMMAKILNALGKPDAPIMVAPPVPQAKVTVVLGGLALKKYFPGMKGEPGQWQKTPEGRDVLITYSPAYILRFGTVTPAVQKIKQEMWLSLKAVKQRLAS